MDDAYQETTRQTDRRCGTDTNRASDPGRAAHATRRAGLGQSLASSPRPGVRRGAPRLLAASLALAGLSGISGVTPGSAVQAAAQTTPARSSLGSGSDESGALPLTPASLCGGPTRATVRDGSPIVVDLPPLRFTVGALNPTTWTAPPSKDPAWQMWFQSMKWAKSYGMKAYRDQQPASLRAIIDQSLAFYRAVPDRGASRDGWDEGTALRRLETMNCLYALSHDRRIPSAMAKDVAVLTGPRYIGPPRKPVHNHGLMANERMVIAGALTGRSAWVDIAQRRLTAESRLAFSPLGSSYEQSTKYHLVNYAMWTRAAALLTTLRPQNPAIAPLRAALARAAAMGRVFTEPDGSVVQIGDSNHERGLPSTTSGASAVRDDRAGYAVGRWSGTDPDTTYYSLRYGPRRWAHGHFDKSSVTWTTRGSRVLVGAGYTTYDPVTPKSPWWWQPGAHNMAIPSGGSVNARGTGRLTAYRQRGSVAAATLVDNQFGMAHTRRVVVDDARSSLVATDVFPSRVRTSQIWHLDPTWTLVSARGTHASFRSARGATLTLTVTGGTVSRVVKGVKGGRVGWVYTSLTQALPAPVITVTGTRNALTSTFTLTPARH